MIKSVPAYATLALVLLISSGCETSLRVTSYDSTKTPTTGVVYFLPMSQFNVVAKYELKTCPPSISRARQDIRGAEGFKTSIDASLKHSTRSSTKEAYVIDYVSLQHFIKEHTIEISLYDNGMLKSINTSSADKTGDVILSVASAAATLALTNTAGPAGLIALASNTGGESEGIDDKKNIEMPIQVCNLKTLEALAKFPNAKKELKKAQDAADKQKSKVIALQQQLNEAQKTDEPTVPKKQSDLVEELKALKNLYGQYLDKKATHDKLSKHLTIEHTFKHEGINVRLLSLHQNAIDNWLVSEEEYLRVALNADKNLTYANLIALENADAAKTTYQFLVESIEDGLTMKLSVNTDYPVTPSNVFSRDQRIIGANNGDKNIRGEEVADKADGNKNNDNNSNDTNDKNIPSQEDFEGIVYRQSSSATAKLCIESECSDDKYLVSEDFMLPDVGPFAVLPFKNGAFQTNDFEAEFSETGTLKRIKVTSDSKAANQADFFDQLASTRQKYKTQRAQAEEAGLEARKAEIDAVKAESDALEAEALAELQAQRSEELAILKHQLDLLNLQNQLNPATPEVDEELIALQRILTLQKIRNELDTLSNSEIEAELIRLQLEKQIEALLEEQ